MPDWSLSLFIKKKKKICRRHARGPHTVLGANSTHYMQSSHSCKQWQTTSRDSRRLSAACAAIDCDKVGSWMVYRYLWRFLSLRKLGWCTTSFRCDDCLSWLVSVRFDFIFCAKPGCTFFSAGASSQTASSFPLLELLLLWRWPLSSSLSLALLQSFLFCFKIGHRLSH